MKKRLIAIAGAAVLCFSIATSVLAAPLSPPYAGYGFCGGGYSLMWDDEGNFYEQSAFEENLDSLIESGLIQEEDRAFFLERYEWCSSYGYGRNAADIPIRRGGCGMGWRMYR